MASSKKQRVVKLARKVSEGKKGDPEAMLLTEIFDLEQKVDEGIKEAKDIATKALEAVPDVNELVKAVKGLPGDAGHSPTDEELLALITPLIPPPAEDGDTPTSDELLALIRPLIPQMKDGVTPSDERILSLIKPLIPPAIAVDEDMLANTAAKKIEDHLPQLGPAIRNALELLEGADRLNVSAIEGVEQMLGEVKDAVKKGGGTIGWGAHPLTIQQSGTTKAKVARTLNFTGATVSLSPSGVVTIAITGGSGWTIETPVGTVNGSNQTFTATATPKYIVVDGIQYFENDGYTLSGFTITTVVPPTGFIRDIY